MKDVRHYYEIMDRKNQQKTVKRKSPVLKSEIEEPCYLFLDQSTSSGYAVYDNNSRLVLSGVVQKGKSSLQEYKYGFRDLIQELVNSYGVSTIFHEEVYDASNMITTEVLFYIKHMIQDIGYFSEKIEVLGLDHMKWKSELAKPGKFNKSGDHKKQVKELVEKVYPLVTLTAEDEVDAIGMGVSVLIKQKRRVNFYHTTRYNKKLPLNEFILNDELIDGSEECTIKKLRKPFRDAYEIGGLHELPLDTRRKVDDLFRRFLSHRDAVVYIRIPKTYKYWGVYLLHHNISPRDLIQDDQSFILMCTRKSRLK
ncbi:MULTISPECIES: hypothetical protein [Bacillus amyloliquefaciens group]|uniref:hypothetical protein n=1 Tax=Bacillus amyloliquefaciens group TaxID=1938374 RepID=UPI00073C518E|nr:MULTISPECIES: hypothetical protein [Bacillus amyloliquefaciens group]KTF59833.1 hypothetical protein AR691_13965 [Bacillus amyloliquefaciens]